MRYFIVSEKIEVNSVKFEFDERIDFYLCFQTMMEDGVFLSGYLKVVIDKETVKKLIKMLRESFSSKKEEKKIERLLPMHRTEQELINLHTNIQKLRILRKKIQDFFKNKNGGVQMKDYTISKDLEIIPIEYDGKVDFHLCFQSKTLNDLFFSEDVSIILDKETAKKLMRLLQEEYNEYFPLSRDGERELARMELEAGGTPALS